jgi:Fe2+ or Zn2+ uptake regulation protein
MSISRKTHVRVSQIISTDKRKAVLAAILSQKGHFTAPDINDALKARNIQLKPTSVLNVIKSLHYAGFLSEEFEERKTRRSGRSKNLYKVIAPVTSL